MELTLTPRLRAIADRVPEGSRFADIGTDHAYLPVWLLLEGRISSAIAADLREGPLTRARETALRCGVTEQVSFRLCDGLRDISEGEANCVAIAGMGGETIASILEAAPWTRNGVRLLLQPMTSFHDLRSWLANNGYCILDESIVREGKRLYTVMTVEGGEMPPLSPGEAWAGRQSGDPLRLDYLAFMAEKVSRALEGQLASKNRDEGQIEELSAVLDGIRQMEKELKSV